MYFWLEGEVAVLYFLVVVGSETQIQYASSFCWQVLEVVQGRLQESLVEMEATGQAYPKHYLGETELIGLHPLELQMDQVAPSFWVEGFSEAVLLYLLDFVPTLWYQLFQH